MSEILAAYKESFGANDISEALGEYSTMFAGMPDNAYLLFAGRPSGEEHSSDMGVIGLSRTALQAAVRVRDIVSQEIRPSTVSLGLGVMPSRSQRPTTTWKLKEGMTGGAPEVVWVLFDADNQEWRSAIKKFSTFRASFDASDKSKVKQQRTLKQTFDQNLPLSDSLSSSEDTEITVNASKDFRPKPPWYSQSLDVWVRAENWGTIETENLTSILPVLQSLTPQQWAMISWVPHERPRYRR